MLGNSKLKRTALTPAVLLFSLILTVGCDEKKPENQELSVKADVFTLKPQTLDIQRTLPGRIEPNRIAEVRARVAGIVLERTFQEGSDVRAGDILYRIDPAPFEASLAQAKGDVASAQAKLFEANSVISRVSPLVKTGAISRQDFDTAQANFRAAKAAEMTAKANEQKAILELNYSTVRAPISGRIGRALVTEGALVGQGEATPLAVIQQIDTVYADFTQPVSETINLNISKQDSNQERKIPVTVKLDGENFEAQGYLLFSDISVDPQTGQLSLRSVIDNKQHVLLPGMYIRVTLNQGTQSDAILVPQRAVKRSDDGSSEAYIVDENNTVKTVKIKTGKMYGNKWHVTEGLSAGDRVVIGGNVKEGNKVHIDNEEKESGDNTASNTDIHTLIPSTGSSYLANT